MQMMAWSHCRNVPPPASWNDVYLLMLTLVCETQLFRGASCKADAYTVILFKEMIINNI